MEELLDLLAAEAARVIRGRVEPLTRELVIRPDTLENPERLLLGVAVLASRGVLDSVFIAPSRGAARLLGRALARLDLAYASGSITENAYRCLGYRLLSFLGRGAGEEEALLLAAERTREAVRLAASVACASAGGLGGDSCRAARLLEELTRLPAVRAGGLVDDDAGTCLRLLEELAEAAAAACKGGGGGGLPGLCSDTPCRG